MEEKIKFIDVNGQQVVDLTPDYERALALVDMDVLLHYYLKLTFMKLREVLK